MKQLKALKNTFYLSTSDSILSLKGNSNADKIKFTVDRYCESIDLSECNCTIKTKNSNNESDVVLPQIDINEDTLDINWTITTATTVAGGELLVQIQFEKLFSDGQGGYDETKTIVWQSNIMRFIVQNSLSSDKDLYDQEPTLFQQWEDRISNLVDNKITSLSSEINDSYIANTQKNIANGVPTLNSNAKLDASNLDDSCVTTSKLGDTCVATSKIASNAITIDKTNYINTYPLNLFNSSDIIENGYYNENGTWVSNTGLISSGLIPVTPRLPYTSSRYGFGTIVTFWKADGTFLIGYKYSSNFTYTIAPQGSVYVRFSFATTDENKSVYQNKYIPNDFEYKIDDEIKINNNNIAKEGLSSDKLDFTECGEDNLYNPNDIITGGYYESTGVWTAGTGMISTGLISVTPGLPYTASNAITGCVTTFWDSSKNFISGQRAYGSVGYVVAPANSKYLRTSFAVSAINKKVVQGKVCPSVCYGSDKILIPNLRVTSENVSNGWKNKKWVSYGDSITWYGYWQPNVAEEFGLNHTNLGVSGSCIAGTSTNAMWQTSRLNAVKNANPDVITILGGANDMYQSLSIGDDTEFSKELSSKNTSLFKGAYSYIIESLLTWKPTLKVFLLTTTWGKLEYNDATTGLNYRDFAKATKEIAWYYGLPCIDLRGEMGLNAMTASTYLMDDGYNIHPNAEGSKLMSKIVISRFKDFQ